MRYEKSNITNHPFFQFFQFFNFLAFSFSFFSAQFSRLWWKNIVKIRIFYSNFRRYKNPVVNQTIQKSTINITQLKNELATGGSENVVMAAWNGPDWKWAPQLVIAVNPMVD